MQEEDRIGMQQRLLKKVASVNNDYSLFLFLIEHLNYWHLYNCEGKYEFS